MIYLLYSLEKFLLNREIDKIKNENNMEEINISYFDLNSDLIEDVLEDAETFSMFADRKMIVVNNANIFTAKKLTLEQDIEKLEKYLENINPSSIIVFVTNDSKLDERKKIVKLVKKVGIVKELNSTNSINDIVISLFGEYKINNSQVKLLIDRVGNNLDILNQEITKLKIYKDDDLIITDEDIVNLTNENIEANLFLLIDSIVNKDKKRAICIYHEMIKMNEEPIAIIISLANKMRGLYQTKELFSKGYKDVDIATILGVKPGYLYYMKDSLKKYDSNTLLKLLKKLADLDYNIKKGSVNKELGLELFILEN
jgi:DNA polymerase-3 subunit delta